MRLFRKGRPEAEIIAEFWQWWATARDDVATAIGDGTVPQIAPVIGRRVRALSPDLDWELGPGGTSAHALAVTPAGRADLRALESRLSQWREGRASADVRLDPSFEALRHLMP